MNFRRKNESVDSPHESWSTTKKKPDRETLATALHHLVSGILSLSNNTDITEDTCHQALLKFQQAEQERVRLLQVSQEAQAENRKLKKEVTAARLSHTQADQAKVTRLEMDVAQHRRTAAQLQAQQQSDATTIQQLQQQVNDLRQQNTTQQGVFQTTLEIRELELSIRTKERDTKAQQLSKLQRQIKTVAPNDHSYQERKTGVTKEKALQQELNQTRSLLTAAQRQSALLQQQQQQQQSTSGVVVAAGASPTAKERQLQHELSTLKSKLLQAQRHIAGFEQGASNAASLQLELSQAQDMIARLQTSLIESNVALSKAMSQIETSTKSQQLVAEYQSKLAAAERKITRLQENASEAHTEAEQALRTSQARVVQLEQCLAERTNHTNVASNEIAQYKTQLAAAQCKIATLEQEESSELEEAEEKLEKSQRTIAKLRTELAQATAVANNGSSDSHDELAEAQVTIAKLHLELAQAQLASEDGSHPTCSSSSSSSGESSDELAQAQATITELRWELAQAQESSRSRNNGMSNDASAELAHQLEKARTKLAAAERKIATLEEEESSELEEAEEKIEKSQRTISKLQTELAQAKSVAASNGDGGSGSDDDLAQAQLTIAELRSELAQAQVACVHTNKSSSCTSPDRDELYEALVTIAELRTELAQSHAARAAHRAAPPGTWAEHGDDDTMHSFREQELETQLEQASLHLANAMKRISDLEKQSAKVEKEGLNLKIHKMNEASALLGAAMERILKLEREGEQTKKELERSELEINNLQEVVVKLNDALDEKVGDDSDDDSSSSSSCASASTSTSDDDDEDDEESGDADGGDDESSSSSRTRSDNDTSANTRKLEQELAETKTKLSYAIQSLALLEAKEDDSVSSRQQKVEQELAETKARLADANQRISILEAEETVPLSEAEGALQKMEDRIAKLRTSIKESNPASAQLVEEIKFRSVASSSYHDQKGSKEQRLKLKLIEVMSELSDARLQILALEEQVESFEATKNELRDSETMVAQLTDRITELDKALSDAARTKAAPQNGCESAEEGFVSSAAKERKLKMKLIEAMSKLSDTERRLAAHKAKEGEALAEAMSKLSDAERRIAALEGEEGEALAEARIMLSGSEAHVAGLTALNNELNSALEKVGEDAVTAPSSKSTCQTQKELDETKSKLRKVTLEADEANELLEAAEELLEETEKKVLRLTIELEQLKASKSKSETNAEKSDASKSKASESESDESGSDESGSEESENDESESDASGCESESECSKDNASDRGSVAQGSSKSRRGEGTAVEADDTESHSYLTQHYFIETLNETMHTLSVAGELKTELEKSKAQVAYLLVKLARAEALLAERSDTPPRTDACVSSGNLQDSTEYNDSRQRNSSEDESASGSSGCASFCLESEDEVSLNATRDVAISEKVKGLARKSTDSISRATDDDYLNMPSEDDISLRADRPFSSPAVSDSVLTNSNRESQKMSPDVEVVQLKKELEESRAKLQETENKISELKVEDAKELRKAKELLAISEARATQLEGQMDEMRSTLASVNQDSDALLSAVRKELEQTILKLREAEDKVATLEAEEAEELLETEGLLRKSEARVALLTEKLEKANDAVANVEASGASAVMRKLEESRSKLREAEEKLSTMEADDADEVLLAAAEGLLGESEAKVEQLTVWLEKVILKGEEMERQLKEELEETTLKLRDAEENRKRSEMMAEQALLEADRRFRDSEEYISLLNGQLEQLTAGQQSERRGLASSLDSAATKLLLEELQEQLSMRDRQLSAVHEVLRESEATITLLSQRLREIDGEKLRLELEATKEKLQEAQDKLASRNEEEDEELMEAHELLQESDVKIALLRQQLERVDAEAVETQADLQNKLEETKALLLEAQNELSRQSAEADSTLLELQAALRESEASMENLRQEIVGVKAEGSTNDDELRQELEATKAELQEVQEELACRDEYEDEELVEAQERLQESEENIALLQQRLEKLAPSAEGDGKLLKMQNILRERELEFEYLREQMEAVKANGLEKEDKLEKSLEQTKAQLVEIAFEVAARDAQQESERKETEERLRESEEMTALLKEQIKTGYVDPDSESELERLRHELDEATTQIVELEFQISALQAEDAELMEVQEMLQESQDEIASLMEKLEEADTRIPGSEGLVHKELAETKSKLRELETKIAASEAEQVDSLMEANELLQESQDMIVSLRAELEMVNAERSQTESNLKEELEDTKCQLRALEEQLSVFEDEHTDALSKARELIEGSQAEISSLSEQLEKVSAERCETEALPKAALEANTPRFSDLEKDLFVIDDEQVDELSQVDELVLLEESQAEVGLLTEQLEKIKAASLQTESFLKAKLEYAEARVHELEETVSAISDERNEVYERLREQESKVVELQLEKLDVELSKAESQLKNELEVAQSRVRDLETHIVKEANELLHAKLQWKDSESKVIELEKLEEARSKTESILKEELGIAYGHIHQLEDKLADCKNEQANEMLITKEQLREYEEHVATLTEQVEKLTVAGAATESRLKAELDSTKFHLQEAKEALSSRKEEETNELLKANDQLRDYEGEVAGLTLQLEILQHAGAATEQRLIAELEHSQSQLQSAKETLSNHEGEQVGELLKAKEQLRECECKVMLLTEEMEKCIAAGAESERRWKEELEQTKSQLQEAKGRLSTHRDEETRELCRVSEMLLESESKLLEGEAMVMKLREQLEQVRINGLEKELRFKNDLEQVTSRLVEAEQKLASRDEETQALASKLQEMRREGEAKALELTEQLEQARLAGKKQQTLLEKELHATKAELAETHERLAASQADATEGIIEAREILRESEEQIKALSEELEKLKTAQMEGSLGEGYDDMDLMDIMAAMQNKQYEE